MNDIDQRRLAPKPGGRVRKPDGSVLAEAGETVTIDRFWRRRLAHGDVIEVEPKVGKAKGDA